MSNKEYVPKTDLLEYISDKYVLTPSLPLYRFKEYEYNERFKAFFPKVNDGKYEVQKISTNTITGHKLAISLYNLANKIDELEDESKEAELIINWCLEYVHPFGFEHIHKSITECDCKPCYDDFIYLYAIKIDTSEFLYQLIEFYRAFKFYLCIRDIEDDTGELAFGYSSNRFKMLSYLEPFKDYLKVLVPNKDVTSEQLDAFKKMTIKEQTEHVFEYYHYADYDDSTGKIINIKHKEKNPDYFITIPIDYIEVIYDMYLNEIKEATFKVVYDRELRKPVLRTSYSSVFDIAWDVLRKMLTDTHFVNKYHDDKIISEKAILAQCPYCNDYFIKSGKNQKCCAKPFCLREKDKLEKRAKRAAKKANKNTTNPNQD